MQAAFDALSKCRRVALREQSGYRICIYIYIGIGIFHKEGIRRVSIDDRVV